MNQKVYLLGIVFLMLFSCKTPKTQEHHYVDYQPYFNQLNKKYVKTPSLKNTKLDTLVQILSNLRDQVIVIKDTINITQEFDLSNGELIIDIDLINEKPPIFDTFMVVKGFLMKDELVDFYFPVKVDSSQGQFNNKPDSTLNLLSNDSLKNQSLASNSLNRLLPTTLFDSLLEPELKPKKKFYSREDVISDTTRVLNNPDSIIAIILDASGQQIGDSIPYNKEYNDYLPDSKLKLITNMVFVEIHDPTREVKQYPIKQLTRENKTKKELKSRFIFIDTIVFKKFFKDEEDVFMNMIRVRGGTFKIGSNEFDEDERPEYKLSVNNFLIGKYEVTNKIFCAFLTMLHCDSLGKINRTKIIDWKNPSSKIYWDSETSQFKVYKGYDDFPVVNVTWPGANLICKNMGGKLPSEAEWEYAAKGGIYSVCYYTNADESDYTYEYRYAGSNYMTDVGWFVDNSDGFCHSVGELKPNILGIHDMCGNVWEWCYDYYSKDFYKRNGDSSNPQNESTDDSMYRVNRGGSWSSDASYCRITNRNFLNEFQCNPYLGFRLKLNWK